MQTVEPVCARPVWRPAAQKLPDPPLSERPVLIYGILLAPRTHGTNSEAHSFQLSQQTLQLSRLLHSSVAVHWKLVFVVAASGAADDDQIQQHLGVSNALGVLHQNLLRVSGRRLLCDRPKSWQTNRLCAALLHPPFLSGWRVCPCCSLGCPCARAASSFGTLGLHFGAR